MILFKLKIIDQKKKKYEEFTTNAIAKQSKIKERLKLAKENVNQKTNAYIECQNTVHAIDMEIDEIEKKIAQDIGSLNFIMEQKNDKNRLNKALVIIEKSLTSAAAAKAKRAQTIANLKADLAEAKAMRKECGDTTSQEFARNHGLTEQHVNFLNQFFNLLIFLFF